MQTYRIFNVYNDMGDETGDIIIFAPRWIAKMIAIVRGSQYDYESERSHQKHYARAQCQV